MTKLTDTEIAYVAGLFEGEASFTFTTMGYPRICLQMCDLDVMTYISNLFNVKLYFKQAKHENHKDSWQLVICKKQVVFDLLNQILPYMSNRRTSKIEEMLAHLNAKGVKLSYV